MSRALNLADCKAALFDVDGTLVDSVRMIVAGLGDAFEYLFSQRPPEDQIRALIGMPLRTQLALYAPPDTSEAEYDRMAGHCMGRFDAHLDLENPFPEAIRALELCHRNGVKTALVTSKSAPEVEHFRQRFDFLEYVDAIVCATDVARPKPWPDTALAACDALGVAPNEAVFIGDSVHDMRCAKAASVPTIAVTYGSSSHEALAAEDPDCLVGTPEQLLACFTNAFHLTPCHERK